MTKTTEFLDVLEASLVIATKRIISEAGEKINDQEARQIIGKIGVRIIFGKKTTDKTMEEQIRNPK